MRELPGLSTISARIEVEDVESAENDSLFNDVFERDGGIRHRLVFHFHFDQFFSAKPSTWFSNIFPECSNDPGNPELNVLKLLDCGDVSKESSLFHLFFIDSIFKQFSIA